jgi:hypothetical protein
LRASAFRVLILHFSARNTLFPVRRAAGGDVMDIGSLTFRLEGFQDPSEVDRQQPMS